MHACMYICIYIYLTSGVACKVRGGEQAVAKLGAGARRFAERRVEERDPGDSRDDAPGDPSGTRASEG